MAHVRSPIGFVRCCSLIQALVRIAATSYTSSHCHLSTPIKKQSHAATWSLGVPLLPGTAHDQNTPLRFMLNVVVVARTASRITRIAGHEQTARRKQHFAALQRVAPHEYRK